MMCNGWQIGGWTCFSSEYGLRQDTLTTSATPAPGEISTVNGQVVVSQFATRGKTAFVNVGPGGVGQVTIIHPRVQESSLVLVTYESDLQVSARRWSYDATLGALVLTLSGSSSPTDFATWVIVEF